MTYKTGTWGIQAKARYEKRQIRTRKNRGYVRGRTPEERALIYKAERYELKAKVYKILGEKCKKCGFSDERALQIDHINGGGCKERRSIGFRFYASVLESLILKERKYQLLCANCNFIKRYENNEFKHREVVN